MARKRRRRAKGERRPGRGACVLVLLPGTTAVVGGVEVAQGVLGSVVAAVPPVTVPGDGPLSTRRA